jgi:hypothetical protein
MAKQKYVSCMHDENRGQKTTPEEQRIRIYSMRSTVSYADVVSLYMLADGQLHVASWTPYGVCWQQGVRVYATGHYRLHKLDPTHGEQEESCNTEAIDAVHCRYLM